jgi:hypothetical protein
MTSELVHRIRTCVAAMLANDKAELPAVYRDAADLMLEASNLLDVDEPLGEPMPILAPSPGAAAANAEQLNPYHSPVGNAIWLTTELLPEQFNKPRVCPGCAQHTAAVVNRVNRKLWLTCQECAHRWEYVA